MNNIPPISCPKKTETKPTFVWAALTNKDGIGLLAVGQPLLNVSVHHYTAQDFTKAQHTYELTPRDEITLNLDYAQGGLGNGSCGPGVLPQYLLQSQDFQIRLLLRGLSAGDSPITVSKTGTVEVNYEINRYLS